MRDVRIMLEKIDGIYERVYSINESLSSESSYYFRKGFEEGINEGLFSFIGNIAGNIYGAAKKAVNWVSGKAKDYWEKGKELAGQAWATIKKWAEDTGNAIKKTFNDVISNISKGLSWVWTKLKEGFTATIQGIKTAYEKLKEKAEALANCVMKILSDIGTQIGEFAKATVKFFKDLKAEAGKAYLEKNVDTMKEMSKDLSSSDVPEIKSIGQQAGAMIGSIARGIAAGAKAAGQGVLNILKFTGALAIVIVGGTIELLVRGIKSIPGAISWVYDKSKELLGKMFKAISEDWNNMFTEFEKAKKSWETDDKSGSKDFATPQSQVQKEKEKEAIKDSYRYLKSFNRF